MVAGCDVVRQPGGCAESATIHSHPAQAGASFAVQTQSDLPGRPESFAADLDFAPCLNLGRVDLDGGCLSRSGRGHRETRHRNQEDQGPPTGTRPLGGSGVLGSLHLSRSCPQSRDRKHGARTIRRKRSLRFQGHQPTPGEATGETHLRDQPTRTNWRGGVVPSAPTAPRGQ